MPNLALARPCRPSAEKHWCWGKNPEPFGTVVDEKQAGWWLPSTVGKDGYKFGSGGRAWKLEVSSLFSVPCHECGSHEISAPNWHQFTTYWFASSSTYLSEGCLARQTRRAEPAVKCASLLGVPCSSFNLNQSAAVKTNRGATRVIKDGVMGALNPRVGKFWEASNAPRPFGHKHFDLNV